MRIVLASGSPSRKQILEQAGIRPHIHPADVDEDTLIARYGSEPMVVEKLAQAKAEAVAAHYPGDVVIGCDSMLLLDGELQGKPHTVDNTIARWQQQRGKRAELITGHHIIGPERTYTGTSRTTVYFGTPTDADIAAYARSGEPLKCAGAFTLEAMGGWFIDRIDGDPSSVIGLSLPLVRQALYDFGINVSELW
ncbi:septum formation inhibitor Maf [Corynebacterium hindlerae]|uniref:Nucleoside triphosphate pyrophosphatase n=1 Tax=Corynebacterium hindlerae TaxID=699041 RepID=A0A7G5FH97_9CORY|nr:nucleoside triphosphate pyrophosphatase [Corynebacterium hindlerae]QMV85988.1 septum formation inhibitor Maf [Corynebacterium hindlerae]QTH60355.1 septum formation inhibitor Maf [Corynebacterium hindlerae]